MKAARQTKASTSLSVAAEQQGAEHGDRLGGHGQQEPGAVDAGAEARLVATDDDGDERRVGEHRPQREAGVPQHPGESPPAVEDAGGAADDVGGGDDGQEGEALGVAGEVGDERPRVADEAGDEQHGEHDVGDDGDREQRRRPASRGPAGSAAMAMMPVAITSAK